MKTVFNKEDYQELISRIEAIRPDSQRKWGSMDVGQMLAHLNNTFDLSLGNTEFKDESNFLLRAIIKPIALGKGSLRKSSPTAGQFKVKSSEQKDFYIEKKKALENLKELFLRGKEGNLAPRHVSFGKMTPDEWGRLTYKHTDHHLQQFGV